MKFCICFQSAIQNRKEGGLIQGSIRRDLGYEWVLLLLVLPLYDNHMVSILSNRIGGIDLIYFQKELHTIGKRIFDFFSYNNKIFR